MSDIDQQQIRDPSVSSRRRMRLGLTTPELIVGLLALGTVGAAVYVGSAPVRNMVDDYVHRGRVNAVAAAVKSGMGSSFGTGSIALTRFISDTSISPRIVSGGNVLNGPYSGNITVTGNGNNNFFVDSANIPASACKRVLLDKGWGGDVVNIGVGTNMFSVNSISEANADTACAGATNAVRIEFVR